MRTIAFCAAATAALGLAAPAAAQTDTYRVAANSTQNYSLSLCGQQVHVRADGDNDTDLDFRLSDDRGNVIHSDFDTTDLMLFTVSNGTSGCRSYNLQVINLGNVYNVMTVTMTTVGGSSGKGGGGGTTSYRINANATQTIDMNLCSPSVRMEARGDEDTDLDFTVTDDRGNTVHTDNDLTDWTVATLRTGGGGCRNFRLTVRNLGDVYNQMSLILTDQ